VTISPDGAWIASGGDYTVRIWNAQTLRTPTLMRIDYTPTGCCFVPASDALAVGSAAGLYLFDLVDLHP
jgi:WD40 repeat protein